MEIGKLASTITKELENYSQEFTDKLKKDTEAIAKECAEELKQTSPVSRKAGSKKYAKGWTIKKAYESNFGIRYRVLNKNKPQITHLLEYGHAKVGGGRVEARPHIKKAEENAKEKLLRKIKEN